MKIKFNRSLTLVEIHAGFTPYIRKPERRQKIPSKDTFLRVLKIKIMKKKNVDNFVESVDN